MGMKLGLSHYGRNIDLWCFNMVLRRIFGSKREEVV
jgi:hypothetical protein